MLGKWLCIASTMVRPVSMFGILLHIICDTLGGCRGVGVGVQLALWYCLWAGGHQSVSVRVSDLQLTIQLGNHNSTYR